MNKIKLKLFPNKKYCYYIVYVMEFGICSAYLERSTPIKYYEDYVGIESDIIKDPNLKGDKQVIIISCFKVKKLRCK